MEPSADWEGSRGLISARKLALDLPLELSVASPEQVYLGVIIRVTALAATPIICSPALLDTESLGAPATLAEAAKYAAHCPLPSDALYLDFEPDPDHPPLVARMPDGSVLAQEPLADCRGMLIYRDTQEEVTCCLPLIDEPGQGLIQTGLVRLHGPDGPESEPTSYPEKYTSPFGERMSVTLFNGPLIAGGLKDPGDAPMGEYFGNARHRTAVEDRIPESFLNALTAAALFRQAARALFFLNSPQAELVPVELPRGAQRRAGRKGMKIASELKLLGSP